MFKGIYVGPFHVWKLVHCEKVDGERGPGSRG
jgi:hypothetical protein